MIECDCVSSKFCVMLRRIITSHVNVNFPSLSGKPRGAGTGVLHVGKGKCRWIGGIAFSCDIKGQDIRFSSENIISFFPLQKVQLGNDQKKAQSERDSH